MTLIMLLHGPRTAPPRAFGWLSLSLILITAGCASSQPGLEPARPAPVPDRIERQLRQAVSRWEGTPHRLGGTSRRGIDCSGFVMVVFDDLFDLQLPRATEDQVHAGRPVRRSALQTGDLVFFQPSAKTRHVGIYLHDGEFAHASSSQGVTRSRLDEPYWHKAYWTARRVLPDRPVPPPPDTYRTHQPPLETAPRPAGTARIGW